MLDFFCLKFTLKIKLKIAVKVQIKMSKALNNLTYLKLLQLTRLADALTRSKTLHQLTYQEMPIDLVFLPTLIQSP